MGFFSKLFGGMSRTRENVGGKVDELVASMPLADDDFYEELTDILIMADVGVNTATDGRRDDPAARERCKTVKDQRPAP